MLKGKLLSDEEVTTIMDKVLELVDPSQDFVLDGFPRTVSQAEWLFNQAAKGRFKLRAVFDLKASEKLVMDRLVRRGRPDDTEEAIDARFNEYRKLTEPIFKLFKDARVPLYEIDASQSAQAVHEAIMAKIKKL
jgi:adenylate kinase